MTRSLAPLDHSLGLHLRDPTLYLHSTPIAPPKQTALRRSLTHMWPHNRSHVFDEQRAHLPFELTRPSGDLTVGIRFTRAFHTRHLPPMGFLIPSTVSTSSRLACPVSYRRHLWDSKNTSGARYPILVIEIVRRPSASTMSGSELDANQSWRLEDEHQPHRNPRLLGRTKRQTLHAAVSLTSATRKQVTQGGGHNNTSPSSALPILSQ